MNAKRYLSARALSIIAAVMTFIFTPSFASAGEPTDQLKSGINAVLNILRDASLRGDAKKSERRAKLQKAITGKFDFTEMARRSLASHWKKRNPQEKEEFVNIFSRVLQNSYIGKIEAYTDEKVRYVKENADNEFARVKTIIVTKRKQEIPINYRMHNVKGKWMVYDVVIEGVSLVNTYRQQFRTILRKSSYADLVKKLREKQAEG